MDAEAVVELLGLEPHPEGGRFRETYRDPGEGGGRGHCTAIYYLLRAGERSRWHRVDAVEIWHWYAGAPLRLTLCPRAGDREEVLLGTALAAGQRPQAAVPAGTWQAAECLGAWTLCGCTVAPAFRYEGFELAPPGWSPAARRRSDDGQ